MTDRCAFLFASGWRCDLFAGHSGAHTAEVTPEMQAARASVEAGTTPSIETIVSALTRYSPGDLYRVREALKRMP